MISLKLLNAYSPKLEIELLDITLKYQDRFSKSQLVNKDKIRLATQKEKASYIKTMSKLSLSTILSKNYTKLIGFDSNLYISEDGLVIRLSPLASSIISDNFNVTIIAGVIKLRYKKKDIDDEPIELAEEDEIGTQIETFSKKKILNSPKIYIVANLEDTNIFYNQCVSTNINKILYVTKIQTVLDRIKNNEKTNMDNLDYTALYDGYDIIHNKQQRCKDCRVPTFDYRCSHCRRLFHLKHGVSRVDTESYTYTNGLQLCSKRSRSE